MQLSEKHRPKTLAEVAGQDKALGKLRRITEREGFDGGAFWIVGAGGIGKTTIADCLARMFCDDLDVIDLNGDLCDAIPQLLERSYEHPISTRDRRAQTGADTRIEESRVNGELRLALRPAEFSGMAAHECLEIRWELPRHRHLCTASISSILSTPTSIASTE